MNCTHPVLYHNAHGALVCHICGAVVGEPPKAVESTTKEEKPVETPKRKRKAKGADGNENH